MKRIGLTLLALSLSLAAGSVQREYRMPLWPALFVGAAYAFTGGLATVVTRKVKP